jgi:hypothetical protein
MPMVKIDPEGNRAFGERGISTSEDCEQSASNNRDRKQSQSHFVHDVATFARALAMSFFCTVT